MANELLVPKVGLFVLPEWKKFGRFKEELGDNLKVELKKWRPPYKGWTLWQNVRFEEHLQNPQDAKNIESFLNRIIELVSQLVSLGPQIDDIIKKLSRAK